MQVKDSVTFVLIELLSNDLRSLAAIVSTDESLITHEYVRYIDNLEAGIAEFCHDKRVDKQRYVFNDSVMSEINCIASYLVQLLKVKNNTLRMATLGLIATITATFDVNFIIPLINSDHEIMGMLVELMLGKNLDFYREAMVAHVFIVHALNEAIGNNGNTNNQDTAMKCVTVQEVGSCLVELEKAKKIIKSNAKVIISRLIKDAQKYILNRNNICQALLSNSYPKHESISTLLDLPTAMQSLAGLFVLDSDILDIGIDDDYDILEQIIQIVASIIDCIINEDMDIYDNNFVDGDGISVLINSLGMILIHLCQRIEDGHNCDNGDIIRQKILIFEKYNLFDLLLACLNDSNVSIRHGVLDILLDIVSADREFVQCISRAGFMQSVIDCGYLDINNVDWYCEAADCDSILEHTPAALQQDMVRGCCDLLGYVAYSNTTTKLQDTKVVPILLALLNRGLLIPNTIYHNYNDNNADIAVVNVDTYTIDSQYININAKIKDKMTPKLISMAHDDMLSLTNGFIRQHLDKLGKYSVSPNDISTITFKYFENDYDRYFTTREHALYSILNMINANYQERILCILNHDVTSLLLNLLQRDLSQQTLQNNYNTISLALETLSLLQKNHIDYDDNDDSSYNFADRLAKEDAFDQVSL